MIGHRGKGMEQLIAQMMPGLQRIFRTARPVYLSASSATGLMEASVRNCGGRRVLALVNGAFSDRFFKIAQKNGIETESLEVPMGQVHLPEIVAAELRRRPYDAVTVVHSETSTGALNPIRELAEVVHKSGDTLLLVDSVSGVAGTPVEIGWLEPRLRTHGIAEGLRAAARAGVRRRQRARARAGQAHPESRHLLRPAGVRELYKEKPDPEHARPVAAVRARESGGPDLRGNASKYAGLGIRRWPNEPGVSRTRCAPRASR